MPDVCCARGQVAEHAFFKNAPSNKELAGRSGDPWQLHCASAAPPKKRVTGVAIVAGTRAQHVGGIAPPAHFARQSLVPISEEGGGFETTPGVVCTVPRHTSRFTIMANAPRY